MKDAVRPNLPPTVASEISPLRPNILPFRGAHDEIPHEDDPNTTVYDPYFESQVKANEEAEERRERREDEKEATPVESDPPRESDDSWVKLQEAQRERDERAQWEAEAEQRQQEAKKTQEEEKQKGRSASNSGNSASPVTSPSTKSAFGDLAAQGKGSAATPVTAAPTLATTSPSSTTSQTPAQVNTVWTRPPSTASSTAALTQSRNPSVGKSSSMASTYGRFDPTQDPRWAKRQLEKVVYTDRPMTPPVSRASRPETHADPNAPPVAPGPQVNPLSPKRSGIQPGDISLDKADVGKEEWVDPQSGQRKSVDNYGLGVTVHEPWAKRPREDSTTRPSPKDPESQQQTNKAASPRQDENSSKGSSSSDSTSGGEVKRAEANASHGSMKVKVTPADGLTQALTPDFVLKDIESAGQMVIDGLEAGVNHLQTLGLSKSKEAGHQTGTKGKSDAPSDSKTSRPSSSKGETTTREQSGKSPQTRRNATEADWQGAEGARFVRKNGQRPTDSGQAAKWEQQRKQAMENWIRDQASQIPPLESGGSEAGIRE